MQPVSWVLPVPHREFKVHKLACKVFRLVFRVNRP